MSQVASNRLHRPDYYPSQMTISSLFVATASTLPSNAEPSTDETSREFVVEPSNSRSSHNRYQLNIIRISSAVTEFLNFNSSILNLLVQ